MILKSSTNIVWFNFYLFNVLFRVLMSIEIQCGIVILWHFTLFECLETGKQALQQRENIITNARDRSGQFTSNYRLSCFLNATVNSQSTQVYQVYLK